MSAVVYADASALVKLVLPEPESLALGAALRGSVVISSELVVTETIRACIRVAPSHRAAADTVLAGLAAIPVSGAILGAAAALEPPDLRTLDAIHLATALSRRAHLDAVVTYDARLAAACAAHGLAVQAPGA